MLKLIIKLFLLTFLMLTACSSGSSEEEVKKSKSVTITDIPASFFFKSISSMKNCFDGGDAPIAIHSVSNSGILVGHINEIKPAEDECTSTATSLEWNKSNLYTYRINNINNYYYQVIDNNNNPAILGFSYFSQDEHESLIEPSKIFYQQYKDHKIIKSIDAGISSLSMWFSKLSEDGSFLVTDISVDQDNSQVSEVKLYKFNEGNIYDPKLVNYEVKQGDIITGISNNGTFVIDPDKSDKYSICSIESLDKVVCREITAIKFPGQFNHSIIVIAPNGKYVYANASDGVYSINVMTLEATFISDWDAFKVFDDGRVLLENPKQDGEFKVFYPATKNTKLVNEVALKNQGVADYQNFELQAISSDSKRLVFFNKAFNNKSSDETIVYKLVYLSNGL